MAYLGWIASEAVPQPAFRRESIIPQQPQPDEGQNRSCQEYGLGPVCLSGARHSVTSIYRKFLIKNGETVYAGTGQRSSQCILNQGLLDVLDQHLCTGPIVERHGHATCVHSPLLDPALR